MRKRRPEGRSGRLQVARASGAYESTPDPPSGRNPIGVGLATPFTYTLKHVQPRWWRELFIGNDGLLSFAGDGGGRVGVYYFCRVDLGYKELISRLDRGGYNYRLPRRWRVKIPKDARRRRGIVTVNIVGCVECYVKVERGRVTSVQVLGSVGDVRSLDAVVRFLRDIFSIEVDANSLVGAPVVKPNFNLLKRLSWWAIKKVGDEWLPVTELGERVARAVAKKLSEGGGWWVDVVSAPRVGKSSGVLLGLVLWVIESGVDGYVVIIVVPNRRLGRQLYKYALGAWKRVLRSLRVYGWNAGMLAERVRIRYYEGMESGCLLGKREHRVEDCLKCPLNQKYQHVWRKVYRAPVPVLDPVVLRFGGFCPFQVLFNKAFWRNSIVIVNYRLLPLLPYILSRMKRVVLYFDEYLFYLMHRVVFRPVKDSLFDKKLLDLRVTYNGKVYAFRDVVRMWNKLFGDLLEEVVRFYDSLGRRVVEENRRKGGGEVAVGLDFAEFLSRVLHGSVGMGGVVERVRGLAEELYGVLGEFYRSYRIPLFRRMMRFVETWFGSLYRVEYGSVGGGELGNYVVFSPEVVLVRSGLGIASAFGGYVYSVVAQFVSVLRGVEVDVITSSVDDSNVDYVHDISSSFSLRMVAPIDGLRYHRVSVDYHRGVRGFTGGWWKKSGSRDPVYVMSLAELFEVLKRGSKNVAVVVDKKSMLLLAKGFERLGWRVEYGRDSDNPAVVDYVIAYRPNGSVILMFHPHGRCAQGVDPPFKDEVETVIVALGVRGRPRHVVPVPRVFRRYVRRFLEGRVVSLEEWAGLYAVVKGGWLLIYDVFSLKYDIHMLAQVVGRFFLSRSMVNLVLNGRYDLRWVSRIRYFVFVAPDREGRVFKVRYVGRESGEEFGSEFNVRLLNVPAYSVKIQYVEVDVSRFSSSGYVVVDVGKVWRWMYGKLRSVYNSLRYCRIQLRYGGGVDEWWLYKKLVYLVSGFEYARLEGKDVPPGLRRMYKVYLGSGVRGLLDYVYSRYLDGFDLGEWRGITRRVRRVLDYVP